MAGKCAIVLSQDTRAKIVIYQTRCIAITRVNQYWLFIAPFSIFLISCTKNQSGITHTSPFITCIKSKIAAAIKMQQLLTVFSKGEYIIGNVK